MDRLVSQQQDLKINSKMYRKPVKCSQYWTCGLFSLFYLAPWQLHFEQVVTVKRHGLVTQQKELCSDPV